MKNLQGFHYRFSFLIYLKGLREHDAAMDNTENVLYSIFTGIVVANFLPNTSPGLKAIELSKECVILLNYIVVPKEEPHFKLINYSICRAECLWRAVLSMMTQMR